MFIPALLWKVLEFIYYRIIKGVEVPKGEEVACPLSGATGKAEDCPGNKAKPINEKIDEKELEKIIDTAASSDDAKSVELKE